MVTYIKFLNSNPENRSKHVLGPLADGSMGGTYQRNVGRSFINLHPGRSPVLGAAYNRTPRVGKLTGYEAGSGLVGGRFGMGTR